MSEENWRDKYLNNGPVQVPERVIKSFHSCNGCKFHHHNMVKSGRDPIYKDNCNHPEADPEFKGSFNYGNLQEDMAGYIRTPEWCPFLKNKT